MLQIFELQDHPARQPEGAGLGLEDGGAADAGRDAGVGVVDVAAGEPARHVRPSIWKAPDVAPRPVGSYRPSRQPKLTVWRRLSPGFRIVIESRARSSPPASSQSACAVQASRREERGGWLRPDREMREVLDRQRDGGA